MQLQLLQACLKFTKVTQEIIKNLAQSFEAESEMNDFYDNMLAFLESHEFHTAYGKRILTEGKKRNREKLIQIMNGGETEELQC